MHGESPGVLTASERLIISQLGIKAAVAGLKRSRMTMPAGSRARSSTPFREKSTQTDRSEVRAEGFFRHPSAEINRLSG